MAKLSKEEEAELAGLNASLSSDDQAELDALNSSIAKPSAPTGAKAIAMQQIEEGDGPVQLATPEIRKSTNDMVSEAESRDLPEIARLGRDQVGTAYVNGSNLLTLGAANRLRDADSGSPFPAAERAAMDKRNPGAKVAGIGIGALLGGAPKIVDAGARGAVGAALPGLAKSAGGRIAGAGLAGAASGAVQGQAMEGDAKTGAAVGGVLGSAGQAIGEGANALVGFLKGKGWIGKFDKAKQSGLMDQAEAEAARGELSKDAAGQYQAADKAGTRIRNREAVLSGEEDAALKAARAPHLDSPADVKAIHESLDSAVQRMPSTGAPVSPEAESIAAEITALKARLGESPTNADVLALRKSYQEAAGFGSPNPTDAQLRAQKIYMALRDGVKDSPIGAADRAYSNAQLNRDRRMDFLSGTEDGPREVKVPRGPDDPVSPEFRAGDVQNMNKRIGRLGDDSVEAAPANDRIAKALAVGNDPEYQAALDELEARKAWMATRFGAPAMPTNLSKALEVALRWGQQNGNAAGARMGLPALRLAAPAATSAATRAGTAGGLAARKKQ